MSEVYTCRPLYVLEGGAKCLVIGICQSKRFRIDDFKQLIARQFLLFWPSLYELLWTEWYDTYNYSSICFVSSPVGNVSVCDPRTFYDCVLVRRMDYVRENGVHSDDKYRAYWRQSSPRRKSCAWRLRERKWSSQVQLSTPVSRIDLSANCQSGAAVQNRRISSPWRRHQRYLLCQGTRAKWVFLAVYGVLKKNLK